MGTHTNGSTSAGQCFTTMEAKRENCPYAIFTQHEDNSIRFIKPEPKADARVIGTIYPPPNAEEILAIRFCSYLQQTVVSGSSGTLYFYRLDADNSTLVQKINLSELRDAERLIFD